MPASRSCALSFDFGSNSLEFFFSDESSNTQKECYYSEGCIRDSRTCGRALLESARGARLGNDVACRLDGDRIKTFCPPAHHVRCWPDGTVSATIGAVDRHV